MDSLPVAFDHSAAIIVIMFSFLISIISGLFPTKSIFKHGLTRLLAQQ